LNFGVVTLRRGGFIVCEWRVGDARVEFCVDARGVTSDRAWQPRFVGRSIAFVMLCCTWSLDGH